LHFQKQPLHMQETPPTTWPLVMVMVTSHLENFCQPNHTSRFSVFKTKGWTECLESMWDISASVAFGYGLGIQSCPRGGQGGQLLHPHSSLPLHPPKLQTSTRLPKHTGNKIIPSLT
jgi:hypothetical protein